MTCEKCKSANVRRATVYWQCLTCGHEWQADRCDECGEEKPIVLVCMIGQRLCAGCQKAQNRISYEELSRAINREFTRAIMIDWYEAECEEFAERNMYNPEDPS